MGDLDAWAEQENADYWAGKDRQEINDLKRKLKIAKRDGFVEGQKKTLGDLLLRECPVKYFNGSEGNAVPSEVIKKKLEELGK